MNIIQSRGRPRPSFSQLAAAWGAVIWLTSVASMLAVEIFFPQVFGGGWLTGALEGALLALYLWLALKSAQEHPQ